MNKLFLITLVSLLLGSCAKNKRVDLVSLNAVRISQISNTGINLDIESELFNGFKQKITVEKADLDVKNNGKKIAVVTLTKEVVLSKNSTSTYNLLLNVRIAKGALSNVTELLSRPMNITIEGTVTGRLGIFRKNVKINHKLSETDKRHVVDYFKNQIGI